MRYCNCKQKKKKKRKKKKKETVNWNKLQESSWLQLMEDNDKMTKTELQTAQKLKNDCMC